MRIIDINSIKPPGGEVTTFQGYEHGANVSFFVVQFSAGNGPNRHRHPYEETMIMLRGEIEVNVDSETRRVESGKIVIIPAGAWHTFKNRSDEATLMVNIHPVPKMITEWAKF